MVMQFGTQGAVPRFRYQTKDFNNNPRLKVDARRGALSAFLDWGAAHAQQNMFVLPTGAARARIVGIEGYATNDITIVLYDGATIVFPKISLLGATGSKNFNLSKTQLGEGGIIISDPTGCFVTPSNDTLQLTLIYVVEFDDPD